MKESRGSDNLRYANLNEIASPLIYRQRLLAEAELHTLKIQSSEKDTMGHLEGVASRVCDLEEKIRGNIEALDYLRGISGLEKPFTNLLENVVRAALVLSQETSVAHPNVVFDPQMDEKLDQCWKYIMQLTDVVQWHVTHAVRYHKFHHRLKSAHLELERLNISSMERSAQSSEDPKLSQEEFLQLEKEIETEMKQLVKLSKISNDLQIESKMLTPLHRRHPLPPGRHGAHVLASIRLPNGGWVHRGERVHVWATSQVASELHHEWQMETIDRKCLETTVPSFCCWLDSPESSPCVAQRRIETADEMLDEHDHVSKYNSRLLAKGFQNSLCDAWRNVIQTTAEAMLPQYRELLKRMIATPNKWNTTNPKAFRIFLEKLNILVGYGTQEDVTFHQKASVVPICFSEANAEISPDTLKRLDGTLEIWLEMREQYFKTLEQSNEQSKEMQLRTSTQHADKSRKYDFNHKITGKEFDLNQLPVESAKQELITSFEQPTPHTFEASNDHASQRVEFHRPDYIESRDLMTQITTPFVPTTIHCPNCSSPFEVDVYDSALEQSIPEAESHSSLLYSPENIAGSTKTMTKGKRNKRKSLFGYSRRRAQSLSGVDTAESSGIGSSPEPHSMEVIDEMKSDLTKVPAINDSLKSSSPCKSLFAWAKRSKSKKLQEMKVKKLESQKFEGESQLENLRKTRPISRSQSWIQHGTPWGYGPAEIRKPGKLQQKCLSDRLKTIATHPRISSNIFNNMETYARSDSVIDNLSENEFNKKSQITVSDKRLARFSKQFHELDHPFPVSTEHKSIQATPEAWEISCQIGLLHRDQETTASLVNGSEALTPQSTALEYATASCGNVDHFNVMRHKETLPQIVKHDQESQIQIEKWDISCQVGILKRNQEVGTCGNAPMNRYDATTQRQYSVSCQVGQALHPCSAAHEAITLLDQNISEYFEYKDASISTHPVQEKVFKDKNLQVGDPWWKHDSLLKLESVPLGTALAQNGSCLRKMHSASTMVGQVTKHTEQQTDPVKFEPSTEVFDEKEITPKRIHTQVVDADVHTSAPTQIRQHETDQTNFMENTKLSFTPETRDSRCSESIDKQFHSEKSKIKTRSKRIQKGRPAFEQYTGSSSNSDGEMYFDPTPEIRLRTAHRRACKARKMLILNIDVYHETEEELQPTRPHGYRHLSEHLSSSTEFMNSIQLRFDLNSGKSFRPVRLKRAHQRLRRNGKASTLKRYWSFEDLLCSH